MLLYNFYVLIFYATTLLQPVDYRPAIYEKWQFYCISSPYVLCCSCLVSLAILQYSWNFNTPIISPLIYHYFFTQYFHFAVWYPSQTSTSTKFICIYSVYFSNSLFWRKGELCHFLSFALTQASKLSESNFYIPHLRSIVLILLCLSPFCFHLITHFDSYLLLSFNHFLKDSDICSLSVL